MCEEKGKAKGEGGKNWSVGRGRKGGGGQEGRKGVYREKGKGKGRTVRT